MVYVPKSSFTDRKEIRMKLGRKTKEEVTDAPVAVELTAETKEQVMSLISEIHVVSEILDDLLQRANQIALAVNVDLKQHISVAPDPAPDVPAPPNLDEGRIRDSPYRRRPVSEQRSWLLDYIRSGEWFHAHTIAKEIASEEREYRYLRSAIGRTFALLLDEGIVERGQATERGSMFRYRLVKR
jgi:hypothetical protein